MNILLLKSLKNIDPTIFKAVVKFKIFDPFSGLVLYKYDELLYPKKYLTFFFYWLNLLKTQISVNKDKRVLTIVKAYRGNWSNNISVYDVYDIFGNLLRSIKWILLLLSFRIYFAKLD